MFNIGDGFFLQRSGPSQSQILHPATVTGTTDDGYDGTTCEGIELGVGDEIVVFYKLDRSFVKQPARIEAMSEGEEQPTFRFNMLGEPVSAERRQSYRVSTVMTDLKVDFGDEKACPLLDVSAVGFSVMSSVDYGVGKSVRASISFDDERYTGEVFIQGMRELDKDRIRYGVYCLDEGHSGVALKAGLQRLSMYVQRKQLRRLARTT
jgi:hypothetical protein